MAGNRSRHDSIWAFLRRMYVNSGGLYEPTPTGLAVRDFSNDDMKSLRGANALDKIIIPGIPGRIVLPLNGYAFSTGVGAARTGGQTVGISIHIPGVNFIQATDDLNAKIRLGSSKSIQRLISPASVVDNVDVDSLIGQDIILRNSGNAELGAGADTNTVKIVLSYIVLPSSFRPIV